MDEHDARELKDRISREEAVLRRAQQADAGGEFRAVEIYPQHGASPQDVSGAGRPLAEDYERALQSEQLAWTHLKSLADPGAFRAAWHAWRSAVEERDRATRALINRLMEDGGASGPPLSRS